MALVCHAGPQDCQKRSRANGQDVLEMVFNITWQESCPVLLQPSQHSSSWSALPLCSVLAPIPGVFHLLKVISSISAHRRGEREMFRAVQHSCKLWYLCLLFLSGAEMLWRGGNCAADDNAEGCWGFCRAFSPFQSHSTVKQWDLMLFQCLGSLPEERSREAKWKCENLHDLLRGVLCSCSRLCCFSFCSSSVPAGLAMAR